MIKLNEALNKEFKVDVYTFYDDEMLIAKYENLNNEFTIDLAILEGQKSSDEKVICKKYAEKIRKAATAFNALVESYAIQAAKEIDKLREING